MAAVPLPIHERLSEFLRRLQSRDEFNDFQSAWDGLATEMLEVEDELSGIARQEEAGEARADGRMYPPIMTRERESGALGVRSFRQKRHLTSFGDNGSIEILKVDSTGQPLFDDPVLEKPGADGRLVSDYRRTKK